MHRNKSDDIRSSVRRQNPSATAGEAPLLLLDDVLSELDRDRRRAFLASIAGFEQAFVTTTDVADVLPFAAGRVIEIHAGELVPAATPALERRSSQAL